MIDSAVGDKSKTPISLAVKDTPLRDAVTQIAAQVGLRVVVDDKGVTWLTNPLPPPEKKPVAMCILKDGSRLEAMALSEDDTYHRVRTRQGGTMTILKRDVTEVIRFDANKQ